MEIPNYDVKGYSDNNFRQIPGCEFMPDRCFRMLICAPSGCGKTNLLVHMIMKPLLYYDKIYLYAKNLEQDKYRFLLEFFEPFSRKYGYDMIEASNGDILPLSEMNDEHQKLVIFDDYLNTGTANDREIRNYFTNSRNKNCSCVYLSQSFYNTDKTIRLNCSHYCIYDFPNTREKNSICRDLGINEKIYKYATNEPHTFLYSDKPRKFNAKNFTQII